MKLCSLIGHRFEPRYNVSAPSTMLPPTDYEFNGWGPTMIAVVEERNRHAEQMISLSKSKTYVRDVCRRCGATTENAK